MQLHDSPVDTGYETAFDKTLRAATSQYIVLPSSRQEKQLMLSTARTSDESRMWVAGGYSPRGWSPSPFVRSEGRAPDASFGVFKRRVFYPEVAD